MADLTITSTQVLPSTTVPLKSGTAGEAIDPGEVVYIKAADTQPYLADNDVDAATATAVGIAVNAADSAEKPVSYQTTGSVTLGAGASMTVGLPYFLSSTAGKIAPYADLNTGDYVTYLGTATSASVLLLNIHVTGAQIP